MAARDCGRVRPTRVPKAPQPHERPRRPQSLAAASIYTVQSDCKTARTSPRAARAEVARRQATARSLLRRNEIHPTRAELAVQSAALLDPQCRLQQAA